MHRTALAGVLAAVCWAQSGQEQAAARQRASVERQRASVERQLAAAGNRAGAALVPLQAARAQPRAAWPSAAGLASAPVCEPLPARAASVLIEKGAKESGLAPALIRAVIERESAFRPCALSPAGAMGLMQLMPGTAAGMGLSDPYDPERNVVAGSRFLRLLLDRFGGDLALALGAYNAGPARVESWGGIPPFEETTAYVTSILDRLR